MPSTIGWLAVAVATGALAGVTIGHWGTVAAWLHRIVEDPAVPATVDVDPVDKGRGRTS
ncbi:MAG TPA: hypothetical protein VFO65_04450 [Acidimicrobiales bacterium]|nr:hypothetical protein [Acidimicrobiales bacterium]